MSEADKFDSVAAPANFNNPNPFGTPRSKDRQRRSSSTSDLESSQAETSNMTNQMKKKLKQMQANQNGQQTLDSFTKPTACTKSEFEMLCSKMEEMKSTLQNVVKISDLDEKIKSLVTKDELKECVSKETEKLQEDNDKIRSQLFDVQRENDAMKLRIQNLETAYQTQVQVIDNALYQSDAANDHANELEQHGRANTIRVYGIADTDRYEDVGTSINKAVDLLNNKMGLDLKPGDVDIAHRLGPFVPKQSRGIILRFTRRVNKIQVMKNKKKLDDTQFAVKEDVCNAVRTQMDRIRTQENAPVWSTNGKIFALINGRTVKYNSDIKTRMQNFEKKRESQANRTK